MRRRISASLLASVRSRLARPFGLALVVGAGLAGSVAIGSAATAAPQSGVPPASVSAPAISGTATVGRTLSASTGSWSGDTPMTFSFQWERCDSSGGSCTAIASATAQTYTLVSADVGHTIRVDVRATNGAGTASQISAATAAVSEGPPANTAPPSVSGALEIGHTLTVSSGSWSGTQPIAIAYQWDRCDSSGGNCATIGGATGSTYKIATADAGHRLVVVVTGTNSLGSNRVVVTAGNIGGGVPVSTSAPKVSGSLSIGSTLTVSSGSWSGTQPMTVSYQWDRCDSSGGNCATIGGATGASYRVADADAGHRLVVVVTGRNSLGSSRVVVTAGNVGGMLPNRAVLVSTLQLPSRLVIDRVQFSPSPIRSRTPITARFHVSDGNGHAVQGALVFALGLPYGWTYNAPETPTGSDGWVTLTIRPTRNMPLRRGALVLFVRARKPGGSLLAGVSTRRLVQDVIR